jgi:hypothetical protein
LPPRGRSRSVCAARRASFSLLSQQSTSRATDRFLVGVKQTSLTVSPLPGEGRATQFTQPQGAEPNRLRLRHKLQVRDHSVHSLKRRWNRSAHAGAMVSVQRMSGQKGGR